jgi:hypothetical protein
LIAAEIMIQFKQGMFMKICSRYFYRLASVLAGLVFCTNALAIGGWIENPPPPPAKPAPKPVAASVAKPAPAPAPASQATAQSSTPANAAVVPCRPVKK